MCFRAARTVKLLVLPLLAYGMVAGCGLGRSGVPSNVMVELPDGTSVETTMGSGVLSFADTVWDFFRVADTAQGTAFVRVRFGSEGELTAFEDNTIAREIFGSTILFDGARHNTTQAGMQYAAATYGAQTADSTGFAFEGRLTGFVAGMQAASGTASAIGEFDTTDPNVVRGTFAYSTQVTLISIPEGNQDDEFSFLGRRVIDE